MLSPHIPVLKDEVLAVFNKTKGLILDLTLGCGGHSKALLESNNKIRIIGFDRDRAAVEFSQKYLQDFGDRIQIKHSNFANALEQINEEPAGILADIGVSSLQLDNLDRGFSFKSPTLDMRMDTNQSLVAYDIINHYSEAQLRQIFIDYGEERMATKISKRIVKARAKQAIKDAKTLCDIVHLNITRNKIHPATKIFQALRIMVNDELGELKQLLKQIQLKQYKNTKLAIISFHSLEDRIVKQKFRQWTKNCICHLEAFQCTCGNNHSVGKIITKKPITASQKELYLNKRARSAKMRIFEFQ